MLVWSPKKDKEVKSIKIMHFLSPESGKIKRPSLVFIHQKIVKKAFRKTYGKSKL